MEDEQIAAGSGISAKQERGAATVMEMNGWEQGSYVNSQTGSAYQTVKSGAAQNAKTQNTKTQNTKTQNAADVKTKQASEGLNEVSGRTIGEPKLSDKALKYYEQLKRKYHNMDFILVSPEKKEEAERMKGMYASSKELLVLIDSDKIEKMAEDEEYRKKYEGILSSATVKIGQMKKSLGANAKKVKSYGMTFDDHGNASFFAVVDKMLAKQRERIADRHEQNAEDKKEADRKAREQKAEEKWQEAQEGKRAEAGRSPSDYVTVTAPTFDGLIEKVNAAIRNAELDGLSDAGFTEEEKKVGQAIDYSL